MADGRTRPLADLEVGDRIYGTRARALPPVRGRPTVLAQWSTVKPAYRVDARGRHRARRERRPRFLTDRGWKHVTGAEQGRGRRPHLTLEQQAARARARFAARRRRTSDYRRGYLCGMVRGDGHCRLVRLRRDRAAHGRRPPVPAGARRRRGARRARRLPRRVGRRDAVRVRTQAPDTTRDARRSGTQRGRASTRSRELDRVAAFTERDWRKGFLAGIFDAEGSCGAGSADREHRRDDPRLDRVLPRRLRLRRTSSRTARHANGLTYVRLRGGLREQLRFFHLTRSRDHAQAHRSRAWR